MATEKWAIETANKLSIDSDTVFGIWVKSRTNGNLSEEENTIYEEAESARKSYITQQLKSMIASF